MAERLHVTFPTRSQLNPARDFMRAHCRHWVGNKTRYNSLLIRHNGQEIAAATFLGNTDDSSTAVLNHLYVLPEQRRKGIGSVTVQQVARCLRNERFDNIVLQGSDAMEFWDAQGFSREGASLSRMIDLHGYVGDPYTHCKERLQTWGVI